ncbi:IucA/IucC family protein, partial [Acinetobacter baumannii]
QAYAPEAGSDIRVIWLAVHKDHATPSTLSTLNYAQMLVEELGQDTVDDFTRQVATKGVDPADYHFMPAHPWQWFNKLSIAFA